MDFQTCSLQDKVHQAGERIKTNHIRCVSHEVGKGVDVIEIALSISIVDQVLYAADFDVSFSGDALYLFNDISWWRVGFHEKVAPRDPISHSRFRYFAVICRAEIKSALAEI